MTEIVLLGGPFNGAEVNLTSTPKRIDVAGHIYTQIVDPDTGEFLGGYAFLRKS